MLAQGVKAEHIWIKERTEEKEKKLAELYGTQCGRATEETLTFLLIKPQQLQDVNLEKCRPACLVSMMAGVSITKIKEKLNFSGPVVRTMTNIALQYGCGVTGVVVV